MKKLLLILLTAVVLAPAAKAQDATHWKGLGLGIYLHPTKYCYDRPLAQWLFRCEDEEASTSSNEPDTDGDGVVDSKDDCPEVAGNPTYSGCPLSKDERMKIAQAAEHIYFNSGSAELKEESFKDLDELAAILARHDEVKVRIEGHTDNTGDDAMNLKLSKERAAAVKDYLIGKGVKADHITSEGYGESRPIASNDTTDGRKQNRRVAVVTSLFRVK